jgi:Caspase domain
MKYILTNFSVCIFLYCLATPSWAQAVEVNYERIGAITAVGINGRFIAFTGAHGRPRFEHVFNLSTMTLSDERLHNLSFNKIAPAWGEFSLTLGTEPNNHAKLELRQLGRVLHEVDWSNLPGATHHVFGFIKSGLWLTGGNNGVLEIYNAQAEKLAALEGHTGTLTAIAINEKWLVSADDKGLIILWDIDEVVRGKKRIQPYLCLVYAKDGEWAAWSEEGLFSSSPNGHTLLNVPSELLHSYRKPELLAKKITSPQHFHRLVSAELKNDTGIFNPPVVSIVNPPQISQKRDLEITAKICDGGGGIQSATLYLRGAPIAIDEATRGVAIKNKDKKIDKGGCYSFSKVVSLADGENHLVLVADNYFGKESVPDKAVVAYVSEKKQKPNLHIATIAVTKYADARYELKYPVEDAKAISQAFAEAGYGIFGSISTYNLFDKNATKEGMEHFFTQLKEKIGSEDVFILFVAGHGLFSSNNAEYYFIPYDIAGDNILGTALGTEELMKLLANVKAAQTLLLFDTCQSGGFDGIVKELQRVSTAQLNFVHRLGRASLMASSKEQVAFEGVRGHGAFTSIILDALSGGADYTGDMLISVDELSVYVSKHLPELTERKWGYRQEAIRNTTGHDFVLGGLNR